MGSRGAGVTAGCVMAGVLLWCAARAAADTVYKWTDERGVVHFADAPPANLHGVERQELPAAPPAAALPAGTPPGGAPTAAPPQGPARVVVTAHQAPYTGRSSVHVTGKVRNVGGADAQDVSVTISAVDAVQGNPCLHEAAPVTPATLHPGESGTFDVDIDSPCLFGNPGVDVVATWD